MNDLPKNFKMDAKYAFLHVPINVDVQQTMELIASVLEG